MKKLLLIFIAVLVLTPTILAQKTVIGTVDYSYKLVGEGSESMAGMMPERMIIKYGENGIVMKMEGGMMAAAMGKTVVNGVTGESFMIKDSEKTIYLLSDEEIEANAENLGESEIKKFDETKTILGYECKKCQLTTTVQGQSIPQTLWVTKKLKTPDYEGKAFKGMAGQGTMNFDVDGFPMLVEIDMPGMPITLELEVTNIEFGEISMKEFEKPAGYTIKPFSEMNPF